MSATSDGNVRTSVAWCAGLALLVGLLVAAPLMLLWGRRKEIVALQQDIDVKQETLKSHARTPSYLASLGEMQAALEQWRSVAANESARLRELASIARSSGVTLAGIQALPERNSLDSRLVSRSHRVGVRGRYDELARFCDALYAAHGLAGIDKLVIEASAQGEDGLLDASVQVAWYAPGPGLDGEGAAPPETQ